MLWLIILLIFDRQANNLMFRLIFTEAKENVGNLKNGVCYSFKESTVDHDEFLMPSLNDDNLFISGSSVSKKVLRFFSWWFLFASTSFSLLYRKGRAHASFSIIETEVSS